MQILWDLSSSNIRGMCFSLHIFETLARFSIGVVCIRTYVTVETDSAAAELHVDALFNGVVDWCLGVYTRVSSHF